MTTGDATIRAAGRLGASARPVGRWLVGNLKEFTADRLGFLARWPAITATWSSARFGPKRILVVNHPDLVEEVLVTQNRQFIKHFALRDGRSARWATGLLTSEGDFWRAQRQARAAGVPPRADRRPRRRDGRVHRADARRLGRRPGPRRPGRHDAADPGDRRQDPLRRRRLGRRRPTPARRWRRLMRSFTAARPARSSAARLACRRRSNLRLAPGGPAARRIIYRDHRRSGARAARTGATCSRCSCTPRTRTSGRRMTDRQLRDEAMTLFMAGHETTANTLAWVWYLLSPHPEVEAKLHAELDAVLGGRRPTLRRPAAPALRRAASSPRPCGSTRPSGSSAARRSSRPRSAATRRRSARPST